MAQHAAHTCAVSDSSVNAEHCQIKCICNVMTYHSFLPDDRHPILHSIHSIWDLGEVVFAESLLAHREGAVVRPRHTEIIASTLMDKNMYG